MQPDFGHLAFFLAPVEQEASRLVYSTKHFGLGLMVFSVHFWVVCGAIVPSVASGFQETLVINFSGQGCCVAMLMHNHKAFLQEPPKQTVVLSVVLLCNG